MLELVVELVLKLVMALLLDLVMALVLRLVVVVVLKLMMTLLLEVVMALVLEFGVVRVLIWLEAFVLELVVQSVMSLLLKFVMALVLEFASSGRRRPQAPSPNLAPTTTGDRTITGPASRRVPRQFRYFAFADLWLLQKHLSTRSVIGGIMPRVGFFKRACMFWGW